MEEENTTQENKTGAPDKKSGTAKVAEKSSDSTAKKAPKAEAVSPLHVSPGAAKALRAPYGSRTRKQILGRGDGSGRGGTSTRGHKGHRSRSGFKALPFFEGGQMPLARRLPKFGFSNSPFKKEFKVVSLKDIEVKLDTGAEITRALLKQKRLFKGKDPLVKLTNKHKLTTLSKKFTINLKEIHVTLAARKVLEASGSQLKEG